MEECSSDKQGSSQQQGVETLREWRQSILQELENFERLEGLAGATDAGRSGSQGSVLPCKMAL
eukprot:216175-Prorocentrum_lima.AAC.1